MGSRHSTPKAATHFDAARDHQNRIRIDADPATSQPRAARRCVARPSAASKHAKVMTANGGTGAGVGVGGGSLTSASLQVIWIATGSGPTALRSNEVEPEQFSGASPTP